ncbi:unnamed protein product [Rotaria sp. Silwood2]|nr:unnamed protein product [Rotaria sp. Silwood2]CAF4754277.1 unnamed protein product [Rotaria sp. Silwood2]
MCRKEMEQQDFHFIKRPRKRSWTVIMIDGLGDVDDDDGIGFEVGEDENDVVNNVGEEDEDSDDDVDVENDGKDVDEEDEDSDDDVDVKNDGNDDGYSCTLVTPSMIYI